jgi:hypothetical protein
VRFPETLDAGAGHVAPSASLQVFNQMSRPEVLDCFR